MEVLKIMVDYESGPLWVSTSGNVENPDPRDVLSMKLAARLTEWAAKFEATLDRETGRDSGFKDPAQEVAFDEEGLRLAREVAQEVSRGYEVHYRPIRGPEVLVN